MRKQESSDLQNAADAARKVAHLSELLLAIDFSVDGCDAECASRGLRVLGSILADLAMDAVDAISAAERSRSEELDALFGSKSSKEQKHVQETQHA